MTEAAEHNPGVFSRPGRGAYLLRRYRGFSGPVYRPPAVLSLDGVEVGALCMCGCRRDSHREASEITPPGCWACGSCAGFELGEL